MKKKRIMLLAATLTAVVAPHTTHAQYYSNGQSPASLKWESFGNNSLNMVFPEVFQKQARRTFFYMDTVRNSINYGFPLPPLRTPVVMTTENFFSNGLTMLAPKRIEIGGIPAIDTYSEPWLKQLATHEYRHMVQFGNINRSTVKVFGWLFGQQAPLLASGMVPFWFLEGDAVMAETQMSSFGRALQPSFTIHYRTLGDEILRSRNPDKWFCGSYRDYVPSHYELGFQLVSYADKKYNEYIGAGITRYTSDYPILIFTTQLALNKYYKTSTKKLFRETFASLNELWNSLPDTGNSPRIVSPPVKIYTTHSYPVYLNDSILLALKEDYDLTSRFVEIDITSGSERTVCHTGPVSTRPVYRDGIIAWTEYRQSRFWEQKVDSRLCIMEEGRSRYREIPEAGDGILYPAIIDRDSIAFVKYHYDGHYSIELYSEMHGMVSCSFDDSIALHGLAWDDVTECFYYIALSDDGMWIGGLDFPVPEGRRFYVSSPAYITIDDLSASDGMLYFNSIYSGKDEAHTIDLATGKQYRISNSRYGSFSPSPSPSGEYVALTTYERDGYKAAVQEVEYWEEVEWAPTPRNIVNAPLKQWDVPVMDDIIYTAEESEKSAKEYPAKKYRRAAHLFNVHSWAPLYYSPEMLMDDNSLYAQFGATVISQNLLGSAESSLGYGYTREGYSTVRGHFGYYGWAPKIDITARWSDRPHSVKAANGAPLSPGRRGNTLNLSARAYLPMLLSSGYVIRYLTPSIQYTFNNTELVYTISGESARESILLASVQYSAYVRQARLDLQPRWGYTLRASAGGSPFNSLISSLWSIYGRIYTPGLFPHHGLTLAATYQRSAEAPFQLNIIDFQPLGTDIGRTDLYVAASANYMLPVAYPDWGLSGVFFLKRIWLNLGFTYAQYNKKRSYPIISNTADLQVRNVREHTHTIGGTVNLDITPFRMPSQATTTLSIGIYKPRRNDLFVTVGFSVPL